MFNDIKKQNNNFNVINDTSYDISINNEYLNLFRELIHDKLGIYISEEKNYLLINKLIRLIKKSNYKDIAELYYVIKNNNKEGLEQLIRYITTTHTFFFRENMHLKILVNDIKLKKIDYPLIWVAASASGEEVYSIIIELLENMINNFFIVATDINKDVLIHLKKGIYNKEKIKDIPQYIVNKYFFQEKGDNPNHFRVKKELKKYFIVKKINLVDHIKFEKRFHYIFCRNVLIYFNKEIQTLVIDNLLKNLDDLGYLFIGQSESLLHMEDKVESVFSSVYNKKL